MARRLVGWFSLTLFMGGSLLAATAAPATAATPRCEVYAYVHLVPRAGQPGQDRLIKYPVDTYSNQNWRCLMSKGGAQGQSAVQTMQASINACYIDPGRISGVDRLVEDGSFGSLTRGALIKVQQYHGIGADGGYGPQTASHMYHLVDIFYAGGSYGSTCLTLGQAGVDN